MGIRNYDIPQGDTQEDIKQRVNIIRQYYQEWKKTNPKQQV